MTLKLYYHPLSSFCHKAIIALYENGTPFEPVLVNLGDAESSRDLRRLWPLAKFPVLRDDARDCTVAEATTIIEYLDVYYPGATKLLPADAQGAWQARMWDRFYDNYVHIQMQKIVGDNLRPPGAGDAFGVEQAKTTIRTAYGMIDAMMAGKNWAVNETYGLVDCAASPALFYASLAVPFDPAQRHLRDYFERLTARPSYARVLLEAEPYFNMFPMSVKPALPGAKERL